VEGAELLLGTNPRTTHAVLEAWEALAAALRFRLAVWNLSLEGGLDLDAAVAGGQSLRAQFAGGTVAILDNAIETEAGPARPHELVAKDQILAAAAHSVHVVWLGSDFDLRRISIPAYAESEAPVVYPSPPALLEAFGLARTERSAPLARQVVAVDVHGRTWLGGVPGEDTLITAARWLQQRLSLEHPDRRHVVIHDFAPEVVRRTLWIKEWRLGRLLVGNLLDTAAGTLVHAAMPDTALTSHGYTPDETLLTALLVTRSFDGKLARLAELIAAGDDGDPPWSRLELIACVVDALCADLSSEMLAVLASPWREGLTRMELERSLPLLDRLVAHPLAGEAPILLDAPEGAALVRMLARLRFFLDSQVRLWEWLMAPWRRAVMLRSVGRALLDRLVDRVFGARGDADRARRACGALARQAIAAHARQLGREYAQAREFTRRSRMDHARALLRAPLERQGIHTSAEELVFPEQRVLSRAEHAAILAADAEAAARRDALARAGAGARDTLLVALPG
jgi:hypothetical protein